MCRSVIFFFLGQTILVSNLLVLSFSTSSLPSLNPSPSEGGKKSPTAQATANAILGATAAASGMAAPKVAKHSQSKLNDGMQWSSETWARSTYLF